ncbi:ABC-2 transporter family protein [Paenibacillus sp. 598K]|uniref:ABC-2 transporter permease n=1 Tax=Paenibacillus sp. 598K TaxID=1117987 RepID=UPI000FFA71FF|nr:ABC-2 transporter permease [Paenibacillus sp. 598K]GBF75403.1 ABC-2 transporter family protein [Paenibacillus sp. 598K]
MIYHLILKDLRLGKRYWALLPIAAVAIPFYIVSKAAAATSVAFALSSLFIVYLFFNSVSMAEEKYRGAAYLCATPYTRKTLVLGKYALILLLIGACYILYTLAALAAPERLPVLGIQELGYSLLLLAAVFGLFLPIQYRLGYEKSRLVFFFFIFLMPFLLPYAVGELDGSSLLGSMAGIAPVAQGVLAMAAAAILLLGSIAVSVRIYARQSL